MPRKERREARTTGWWISSFPYVYRATLTLPSADPHVTGDWVVELRRGLHRTWPDAALIFVTEPNQTDGMYHLHALVLVDAPAEAVRDRMIRLWRKHGFVKVDPELAIFTPPPGGPPEPADPAVDGSAVNFLGAMESITTSTKIVQNAARSTGSAALLLAALRQEQQAAEAVAKRVGLNQTEVRSKLEIAAEVTKAVGYLVARVPDAARMASAYFASTADSIKSDLSTKTRSDLRQLAEQLAAIHLTTSPTMRGPNNGFRSVRGSLESAIGC